MQRQTCRYRVVVLGTVVCAAIALAGCGRAGNDAAVVQVGRTSIAAATVAHWMSVIAGEVSTATGQPEPEVPAPPSYTACIAYRRKYPTTVGKLELTPTRRAQECKLEFEKERLKALYLLISYAWVSEEAGEMAVKLPERELEDYEQRLANKADQRVLVGTRGTRADLRLRLQLSLLTTKVQQQLERESGGGRLSTDQRQAALNRFSEEFTKKWKARTVCRAGYVVPICGQGTGPRVGPSFVPPSVPLTNMTAGS